MKKSKDCIELNGVANIHMILDMAPFRHDSYRDPGHYEMESSDMESIKKQLDLLERYMIAFSEHMNEGTTPPAWHEVTANPNQYKTNRERSGR